VHEEGKSANDPAPLKVKQINYGTHRYIVCLNERQARREAKDREAIIASLKDHLKKDAKRIVGNKGDLTYLKIAKDSVKLDEV
jgi:hypothetical protein